MGTADVKHTCRLTIAELYTVNMLCRQCFVSSFKSHDSRVVIQVFLNLTIFYHLQTNANANSLRCI